MPLYTPFFRNGRHNYSPLALVLPRGVHGPHCNTTVWEYLVISRDTPCVSYVDPR
jgi:hypothetical protein